jgi:general secretion pathway protein D
MRHPLFETATVFLLGAALAWGQQRPPQMHIPGQPIPGLPAPGEQTPPQQQPQQQQPAQQPTPTQQPAPAQPAPAAQQPAPAQTAPAQIPPAAATEAGGFRLQNVSLTELVDILARRLKINYILDPRVKGAVTINTYGEVKPTDLWQLLETILRINGAAIVKVGDLYRIVPLGDVARLPIKPQISAGKELTDDEHMVLNLIFLKYATAPEVGKLITPFLGESGTLTVYDPANLLIIMDNARNMKRTMELIALFDSETFASSRVKLFTVENGRPSDIAKELENVFKAFALSDKAAVRFMPIDRINTIVAVAPNPGIFAEVENWLKKFDVPVKVTAGSIDNYVYRLKYGRAETIAFAIMMLYGGGGMFPMMGMGGMGGMGGFPMGGMGGFPMGGMGGGMYGMGGMGMGGFPMGGMYGGSYGGAMYGGGMFSGAAQYSPPLAPAPGGIGAAPPASPGVTSPTGSTAVTGDLTGSYLGAAAGAGGAGLRIPHIVPNPFDNTLLIQATPQEWDQISRLLEQLDIPPRQVLIEAKIYEVNLTGAFTSGVTAYFQNRGADPDNPVARGPFTKNIYASGSSRGLALTAGTLVGQSRELLLFLTAQEDTRRSKVISAPSLIATDSIPAVINVGIEVPTLASQAVAGGVQSSGSSVFTNTVQNRNTGVTLNITARVNSSGIVTLLVNQEVSNPQPPSADAAIQSPSFSKRNVQTQVTVQDGDTIAIGGIIQETDQSSSAGIPVLHRLPVIGGAFGAKSLSKQRTELVIFLTPRVIYDTNEMVEASDELRSRLKRLQKLIKE